MVSDDVAETRGLEFFPVDIGYYDHHPHLATAVEVDGVTELLEPFGALARPWTAMRADRGADAVNERLDQWSESGVTGDTVLYWVGHGASDGASTALLAHSRSPNPLTRNGITPNELLHHLKARQARREAGWAIVIIDACNSLRFVELMSSQATVDADVANFLLIAASQDGATTLGAFRRALAHVLTVTFRAQDTVNFFDLARELNRTLRVRAAIPHSDGRAELTRTWPTPAGRMQVPLDIEIEIAAALAALTDDERRHFVPKAAGGELGEQNWYFEGRETERYAILSWLTETREGLLVVTGAAGSGKSALLGHALVHTRPELATVLTRAGYLTPLPPGTPYPANAFDTVVHLAGATPQDLIERLAAAAEAGPPSSGDSLDAQVAWLSNQLTMRHRARRPGQSFTVLVDALDEAELPLVIAAQILTPLARVPGVRVVVGTRSSTQEGPDLPGLGDPNILEALGIGIVGGSDTAPTVLSVGFDHEAAARYVRRRLHAAVDKGILSIGVADLERVANTLGNLDQPFLFARLAVYEILHAPSLARDPAPLTNTDHRGLFARAVDRLARLNPANGPLLEALALAQGHGLPDQDGVWAAIASAFDPALRPTSEDITALADAAAPYLMADTERGQTVYRLAHRTFAEHFTDRAASPISVGETHQRITARLTGLADEHLSDIGSNPYLAYHLPTHAALGGPSALRILADHPQVLDRLDATAIASSVMLHAYGRYELPTAIAGTVAALHHITTSPASNRRGLREIATIRYGGVLLPPRTYPDLAHTWSVRWGHLTPHPRHLILTGPPSSVISIEPFAGKDGRTLILTRSQRGIAQIWDPITGQTVGQPLSQDGQPFTTTEGRILFATGGSRDEHVRIWDPTTGQTIRRLPSNDSIAVGISAGDGRTLIATGGGPEESVRVWDLSTGETVTEFRNGKVAAIVAFTLADGQARIATRELSGRAYDNGEVVRIWNLTTGQTVGDPAHHSVYVKINAIVTCTAGDGSTLIATATDGRVQIWDSTTGRKVSQLTTSLTTVATFTTANGHAVLAVAGTDNVVRFHPVTGPDVFEPLAHGSKIDAMAAFTTHDGRILIGTASGGAVRIWDPSARQVTTEHPTVNGTSVAAFPTRDGRTLIATGGNHGNSLQLWDPTTGEAVGAPLQGDVEIAPGFTAFLADNGRTLIASTDRRVGSGTVPIWDPTTDKHIDMRVGRGWASAVAAFQDGDGHAILVTVADGTVGLWNPNSGQPIGNPFSCHSRYVSSVAAVRKAGGGAVIATVNGGTSDGDTVQIWDADTGGAIGQPFGIDSKHVSAVVAFLAADGRVLLAIAGLDGAVRIWDADAGVQLLTITTGLWIYDMAFIRPDLALSTREGLVLITLEPSAGL